MVECLDCGRRERDPCAHLRKDKASVDGTTVRDDFFSLVARTDMRNKLLRRIVDLSDVDGDSWVCLEWDGLPDEHDWTWSRI